MAFLLNSPGPGPSEGEGPVIQSVMFGLGYYEEHTLAESRKRTWPPSLTSVSKDPFPEALLYARGPLILYASLLSSLTIAATFWA